MTLSQRLLVADAHRMIRDEGVDRVEVGSSDVRGSENIGADQSDAATGSERGDADASGRSPTPSRRVRKRVRFDQTDCHPTIYHPVRHPNTIAYPEKFFESAQAIAVHSHLRWPDLSREWIRRQQARIARVDWESRLPCVLGPRKSRLPLFTRKQQRLLDKAREMDGVPDLSALLKGKLQLLSKKSTTVDPHGPSNSGGDGASEGGGTSRERASKEGASREGAPIVLGQGVGAETSASGPKKKKMSKKTKGGVTDEVPPEESASLDATSEGLKEKKKKDGKKRSHGGAASSVDRDEGLAEGQEGALVGAAPDGRPKKRTKRSVEAEPHPSTSDTNAADATLVDVVGEDSGTPENLSEEGRKTSSREGGSGDEPRRSAPDSSARKSSRSKEKLGQARLKAIERVRAEHKKANEKAAKEKEILRVKFEELEGKLKSARAAKKQLARENIPLEQAAVTLEKEKTELLEESCFEKANRCLGRVRDHFTRLDAFGKAKNLYGQALGTKKCLEMIRASGTEIPQEMIDVFVEQEKLHEAEATKLCVCPLSDSDLTLSPLVLPSRFVEDRFRASFDPYGSNVNLIRAETASQLITSLEITEEPSEEPLVDVMSVPAEHVEVPEGGGLDERPENENLEEVPRKDILETGDTPVREEDTKNVGIEDPVLVSDSSSEGREDEEEEDDRVKETSPPQPVEEETTNEVGDKDVQKPSPNTVDSLVPVPTRVEDPAAAATEDPVGPPALGTPEEDDQDSAP
ncbi:hypothetical protein DY000_02058716 [Brassica cretica]|uniref:Uncharacterized protein n=1 Tax=Brassica cretica TaxID=69181 RepID=A0ABQ7APF5_BRACR|nr:hypothetical protein DY000_02058716 [Brassica cretica]